jgi:hypothetical protein
MGVITTMSEASEGFASALEWNEGVGPLSGKTIVAVVVWLVAWAALHFALRRRNTSIMTAFVVSMVLTVIGVLLTLPPVFGAIAGE